MVGWHDRVDRIYAIEDLLPPGQSGRGWEAAEVVREYGQLLMTDAVDLTASLWLTAWQRSEEIKLPAWAFPPP